MRVLFVGESWLGSCARSLKEALARHPGVVLDEVNEDLFLPKHSARWMRAVIRVLLPAHRQELYQEIQRRAEVFQPDVIMVYKGHPLEADFIRLMRAQGHTMVNVYPDLSPHAHGLRHKQAVGAYDVVVSTKPFHPGLWHTVYGYANPCVFVPQGYDPALHLMDTAPHEPHYDIILVATWRPEYGVLMQTLGALLAGRGLSVGIGGNGWAAHRGDYPAEWTFAGGLQGRAYVDWLRQGRICLAPVMREVVIAGAHQPGDEDSTRTYELAAAYCFFIHRRTRYVQTLYDEHSEVPLYETAEDLAEKILYFLPLAEQRRQMAAAAHRRAVSAYSMDVRAGQIVEAIQPFLRTS